MKKAAVLTAVLTAFFCLCCNVGAEAQDNGEPLQWGEWEYFIVDGEAHVCGYSGTDREITIPSEIGGLKVTALCSRLKGAIFKPFFRADEPQTVSVTVPEGVRELKRHCLSRSHALERVILPSTLERIGEEAFFYSENLTEVNIPENVKWIGAYAFNETGIKSVTLPDGLEGIDDNAFDTTPITEIVLPDSVIYLGRRAFCNCEQLFSVKLSEGLTEINPSLFEGCTSLKTLVFPQNIRYVDYGVFTGCTALESVYYPDSAEYISGLVLYGDELPKLTDIYFEGTERRFGEISGGSLYDIVNEQNVTYHYNYSMPSKNKGFVLQPLAVVFMVISALLLCGFIAVMIYCMKLKKQKTPQKYGNIGFTHDLLGSWECESCGTLNGSIGEYCYKCGKKRK